VAGDEQHGGWRREDRPSDSRWAAWFDSGQVRVEVDVRQFDVDESVTASGEFSAAVSRTYRPSRRSPSR